MPNIDNQWTKYLEDNERRKITNVVIITHSINNGREYGVYSADVNGEKHVFVENEGEIGIIVHFLGRRVSECLIWVNKVTSRIIKEAVEKVLMS